jgi:hypothetical protein
LARYFSAESGYKQISWILEGQIPANLFRSKTSLNRISLKEYNTSADLFGSMASEFIFTDCAETVSTFYPFSHECNALVANVILHFPNNFRWLFIYIIIITNSVVDENSVIMKTDLGEVGHSSAQINPGYNEPRLHRTKMTSPKLVVISEFDCNSKYLQNYRNIILPNFGNFLKNLSGIKSKYFYLLLKIAPGRVREGMLDK